MGVGVGVMVEVAKGGHDTPSTPPRSWRQEYHPCWSCQSHRAVDCQLNGQPEARQYTRSCHPSYVVARPLMVLVHMCWFASMWAVSVRYYVRLCCSYVRCYS